MQKSISWQKNVVLFLILACAVFTLFGRTYQYDYSMLDDQLHLEGNRNLLRRDLATFKKIWTRKYEVVYTPVTYTFWSAIAGISKAVGIKSPHSVKHKYHPGFFHITNALFHLLTVWIVFLCLSQLSLGILPSLIGALLFAIHPVQVETVTWLTGFRDVLAGFFGFASVLYFIKGIQDQSKIRFSFLMLITFLLSILSKSSGLVVVPFQLLIGWLILNRPLKEVLKHLSPLFLAIVCFTPIFIIFNNGGLSSKMMSLNVIERMAVILHNTGFYATKLFFPLNNVFDYGLTPEIIIKQKLYETYFLILIPLFFLLVLFDKQRKEKMLTAIFLLFFVGFFPVSGIIPFIYQLFSAVADRYLYFSLFSLSLLAAYLIQQKPKITIAVLSVFIAFFAFQSNRLVNVWSKNETFNRHIIKYNPNSWLAHNNLGVSIEDKKDYEGAYQEYRLAAELSDAATAWTNAGSMALKLEKYDLAEDIYRKALRASNNSAHAKINLATALALQGHADLAQNEMLNLNIEPICSNAELLENKSIIESNDIKKLKSFRMEARF